MEEKIIYTDWAVANVFSDGTIELHKDLAKPEYAFLREHILEHEREHDFNKGLWYNFQVDFFNPTNLVALLTFMAKRPKTWSQLLPIFYTKQGGITYDKNLFIFYFIILLGIFALIKIIGGI